MLVAPAEQVSRDRSLASQRDWPGATASRLISATSSPWVTGSAAIRSR